MVKMKANEFQDPLTPNNYTGGDAYCTCGHSHYEHRIQDMFTTGQVDFYPCLKCTCARYNRSYKVVNKFNQEEVIASFSRTISGEEHQKRMAIEAFTDYMKKPLDFSQLIIERYCALQEQKYFVKQFNEENYILHHGSVSEVVARNKNVQEYITSLEKRLKT